MTKKGSMKGVRCDRILEVIRKLEGDEVLQDIYGKQVTESLVVAGGDTEPRIEEGGAVRLTGSEKSEFTKALKKIIECDNGESEENLPSERVRIRCDVLSRIITDLCKSSELKAIFGGNVSEHLFLVTADGDLKIESGNITLTEQQNNIFLRILGKIVEENTS